MPSTVEPEWLPHTEVVRGTDWPVAAADLGVELVAVVGAYASDFDEEELVSEILKMLECDWPLISERNKRHTYYYTWFASIRV